MGGWMLCLDPVVICWFMVLDSAGHGTAMRSRFMNIWDYLDLAGERPCFGGYGRSRRRSWSERLAGPNVLCLNLGCRGHRDLA
jgi:hypothetical protein